LEEEEKIKRMKENGELSFQEVIFEPPTEEQRRDFLNQVKGVYEGDWNEDNISRAERLLEKFGWNIPKVVDNVKKNKAYYKKYFDGLTGN